MKNESITGGFQKLKQDLAGMTFRQKAEHIWTYYRSWVIVACAIVLVLSILGSSFINLTTDTLVAGASVNVVLQSDAEDYMSKDLEALLKTGDGRQQVLFQTAYTDANGDPQNTLYLIQNIHTLVASKDLDYMLLDQEAMRLIVTEDIFIDLTEVFTPEELEGLTVENIKSAETGEIVPCLVNISDWPIVKQGADSDTKYYFAIVGNTTRLEAVKTAFAHLQNYGK